MYPPACGANVVGIAVFMREQSIYNNNQENNVFLSKSPDVTEVNDVTIAWLLISVAV